MWTPLAFSAALPATHSTCLVKQPPDQVEHGRRLAWGKLGRGQGKKTAVFGGGGDGNCFDDALDRYAFRVALGKNTKAYRRGQEFNPTYADQSSGQATWIAQQIFAQTWSNNGPHRGTFLEFGARDGLVESNTKFFELALGWGGLLIEAGRDYIAGLRGQRRCTSTKSNPTTTSRPHCCPPFTPCSP